jgi:hypothetical protein
MELEMAGAAGVGLVWGSLLCGVARQVRRLVWSVLWLALATVLLATTLVLVSGSFWILLGFALSAAAAAGVQQAGYHELRGKRGT